MPTTARRSCSRVSSSASASCSSRASSAALGLAAVERLEGLGRDALLRQADPGGDACGGEVALVALDGAERIVLRPALESLAGQGDGDVGAARLQFGRLAQGELVAGGEQLVGARGKQRVEELLDLGLRHRADELVDDRAVAKCLYRRDSLHAEARRQRLVGVDVDLGQHHLAAAGGLGRLQRRGQRAARPAPLGPEVDHDRHRARALDHLALESRLADVDGHAAQDMRRPAPRARFALG